MTTNYGMRSIFLFFFSIFALLLLTFFESALTGLSISQERILSLFVLVIPSLAGVVFGIQALLKKESRRWIAILGIILNGLFTAFMSLLLLFAG